MPVRAQNFLILLMAAIVTLGFWTVASTGDAQACPRHVMAQTTSAFDQAEQTPPPQSDSLAIVADATTTKPATKRVRHMGCPGRNGGLGSGVLCCHHVEVSPAIETRETAISTIRLGWQAKPAISIAALAPTVEPAASSSDHAPPWIGDNPTTRSDILAQTRRLRL